MSPGSKGKHPRAESIFAALRDLVQRGDPPPPGLSKDATQAYAKWLRKQKKRGQK